MNSPYSPLSTNLWVSYEFATYIYVLPSMDISDETKKFHKYSVEGEINASI